MPPNLHSVPALLLVNQKYRFLLGDDIVKHYHPDILEKKNAATSVHGEPVGFPLLNGGGAAALAATSNVVSEKYTMYNMTPDDLSAKGTSNKRSLYHYASAADEIMAIHTPPDTYRPDKVSNNVTVDNLQQKRIDDINQLRPSL